MSGNEDDEHLHQAAQALKAIKAGTATVFGPYKYALYGRVAVEKWFEFLGRIYTSTPAVSILLFAAVIVVYGCFCVGFVRADAEDLINELFISIDDDKNLDYTDRFLSGTLSTEEFVLQHREGSLNDQSITDSLLDHLSLVRNVINLPVTWKGR